jgi:capsular exopolysaccharide synthesis family protein
VTNVLIGDSSISEVTSTTNIENLSCVTAGPTPPNPADLLHSERFKDFLRTMESMFDHVVIDSPPLVAVTDAAIVSTLVDTTIFVSRAFVTSRQLARRGLRSLRDVDSRIAGVVLNAVNLNRAEYVYQYHQYYYNTASGPVPSKKRSRMSAREDDDLEVASTEQAPMN